MSETLPNQESLESQRERLVLLLKERGLEDPEAKKLFSEWARKQELEVEAIQDREASHRAQIDLEIKKAKVLYEASFRDDALDNLDAAREMASQEGFDNLYQEIMDIMANI